MMSILQENILEFTAAVTYIDKRLSAPLQSRDHLVPISYFTFASASTPESPRCSDRIFTFLNSEAVLK